MKFNLNGKWEFKNSEDGEYMDATVPGCNYTDLLALKKISDPFIGLNEKDAQWVAEKEWTYRKIFDAPEALLSHDRLYLCFKRLDTVCEINVNDKIFHAENAFYEWRYDITDAIKEKDNILTVRFFSPVLLAAAAYAVCKTPLNNNGQTGIVHIRKPACHFGWDWAPTLPLSGITGDVYIEGHSYGRITDFHITQKHNYDGSVMLSLSAGVENFGDKPLSATFSVMCPDGSELNAEGINFDNGFKADIFVLKPELWWTRELSDKDKQPLYEAIVSLSADGKLQDGKITKIGLRTISLNRDKDEYGQNFSFELNGVKVFAKGASYVPADSFMTRISNADVDKLISAALFSNMNMLRIWGGGYYADDYFMDRCDEAGILVWQDFMFACQGYPLFLSEYKKSCLTEAEAVIKRLRNHPSLALWCGNNEIEQMSPVWYYMKKYIVSTEDYFYFELPKLLKSLDDRDYIAGSPVGVAYMYGFNRDNAGDTHLWQVWHGLQSPSYYRKRFTRFCSEYGLESFPDEKTVAAYTDGEDYNFKTPAMASHQKCRGGNGKIKYYGLGRFNRPSRFTDYVYISQFCQAAAVKDAAEHWRRNKGRCNGALYWQLNDCWPTASWAGVDYYGRYKALCYEAKRFFKPLTVSIEDSDGGFYVYALNDTNIEYNAKLTFKVCNYDGKVLVEKENDVTIKANESQKILGLGMAAVRIQNRHLRAYAVAVLSVDGIEAGRAICLIRKEKYAKLPKPEIDKTLELSEDGTLTITLSSDYFARGVRLDSDVCDNPFSDNWFDILPSESVTVTQKLDKAYSLEEAENALHVFTAADLTKKGNAFTDALIRLSIYLKPVNWFSHLFTKGVPRNINKRIINNVEYIKENLDE